MREERPDAGGNARPIGQLLPARGTAQALLRRAALLERVQNAVRAALDERTAPLVRVANVRDGTLVLYAEHAAAATRARFAERRLLERVRTELRIEVWKLEITTLPATAVHRLAERAQAGAAAGKAPE